MLCGSNPQASLSQSAPWYGVPSRQIVSVEHPGVVKNIDAAIETLGGPSTIPEVLDSDSREHPINLFLRPKNRASRPLTSISSQGNNLLLRVTVPKRTGRKRKRNHEVPWLEDPQKQDRPRIMAGPSGSMPPRDAKYVLESLRDNKGKYIIDAVGQVDVTHSFRTIPDFVYSSKQSPLLKQFRDKILRYEYPRLKDFELDLRRGVRNNADLIPPPVFSTFQVPHNYAYRQNPGVTGFVDEQGQRRTINMQAPQKINTEIVLYNVETVPHGVSRDSKPIVTLDSAQREMIDRVRKLFEERPIWTRRALNNQLPDKAPNFLLKYAISYCGYTFRSGPWRDAIVRFGVDPRTDPKYRIYQTLMFQLVSSTRPRKGTRSGYERGYKRTGNKQSHIFTGKLPFPPDGKIWQLCDIQDPIVANILCTTALRDTCDTSYFGWYKNGTIAKVKVILRWKTNDLMRGITPTDQPLLKLLSLPEEVTEENQHLASLPSLGSTLQELSLASSYKLLSRASMLRPEDKRNVYPAGDLDLGNESRSIRKPNLGRKRQLLAEEEAGEEDQIGFVDQDVEQDEEDMDINQGSGPESEADDDGGMASE